MGGGNMQQLARQAQKLQQQMTKMQEELEAREYEASAGGGVVSVKVNGKKELLELTIAPEALEELKAAQEKKSLRISSDQISSPTYAKDLAKVICDLIVTDKYGIWQARNEGYYSRAEFASLILKKTGSSCRIMPVLTSELPGVPRRPLNCRMAAELPAGIGPMPTVEDALDRCLRDMNR